uniref:Lipocalin-like domain-containing protein n=1 Tax=Heterorhabditis bacteriophora TaxID=37862 RepID=A0A1I7XGC8_HETBA
MDGQIDTKWERATGARRIAGENYVVTKRIAMGGASTCSTRCSELSRPLAADWLPSGRCQKDYGGQTREITLSTIAGQIYYDAKMVSFNFEPDNSRLRQTQGSVESRGSWKEKQHEPTGGEETRVMLTH